MKLSQSKTYEAIKLFMGIGLVQQSPLCHVTACILLSHSVKRFKDMINSLIAGIARRTVTNQHIRRTTTKERKYGQTEVSRKSCGPIII